MFIPSPPLFPIFRTPAVTRELESVVPTSALSKIPEAVSVVSPGARVIAPLYVCVPVVVIEAVLILEAPFIVKIEAELSVTVPLSIQKPSAGTVSIVSPARVSAAIVILEASIVPFVIVVPALCEKLFFSLVPVSTKFTFLKETAPFVSKVVSF